MVQEGELKHALVYLIVRLYSLSKTQAKPRKANPTELAGEYNSLRNHSEKFLIGIFLSYLIFEIWESVYLLLHVLKMFANTARFF